MVEGGHRVDGVVIRSSAGACIRVKCKVPVATRARIDRGPRTSGASGVALGAVGA